MSESVMTPAQRKAANDETIRTLLDLQQDIGERTESQTEKARKKADITYRDLRYMIWGVFLFGLALLIVAIGLFVTDQGSLEVLGLGTLGVADCITIFFYKPMDRLQKANADYVQQFTILKGWATTINLQLLAMNVTEPDTVITAANNIEKVSIRIADAFQKFIE